MRALRAFCAASVSSTLLSTACVLVPLDAVTESERDAGGVGEGAAPGAVTSDTDVSEGGTRSANDAGPRGGVGTDSGAEDSTLEEDSTLDETTSDVGLTSDMDSGANSESEAREDAGLGLDSEPSSESTAHEDSGRSVSDPGTIGLPDEDSGTGTAQQSLPDVEPGSGTEWFVDAASTAASPSGTDWDNAFTWPQQAMDAASAGDRIWIAVGEYRPPAAGQPVLVMRDDVLVSGRVIAGTYPPQLADFEEHEGVITPETILTGDFAGDDGDGSSQVLLQDNSPHVVIAASDVTLSNLTIRDGYASGAEGGAGLRLEGADSVLLREVHVRSNDAVSDGGGIFVDADSRLSLDRCTLYFNSAANGAGVYYEGAVGELSVEYSTFHANHAIERGGGVYSRGRGLGFYNVVLSHNEAGQGGGAYLEAVDDAEFGWTQFVRNSALASGEGVGGGLYAVDSNVNLVHGATIENTAVISGGGMQLDGGSVEMSLQGFHHQNQAPRGAGIYLSQSALSASDQLVIANQADYGGGIFSERSTLDLDAVTFSDNDAVFGGGGAYSRGDTVVIEGSFAVGNSAGDGGALDLGPLEGAEASLQLSNSVFFKNEASGEGGALRVDDVDARIVDAVFARNTAEDGAAVAASGASQLELLATDFVSNVASGSGGAVFVSGATELTLLSAAFSANLAGQGSVLYASTSQDAFLGNVSLLNNADADTQSWIAASSDVLVVNSALWSDEASELDVSGPVALERSCSQDLLGSVDSVLLAAAPFVSAANSVRLFLDQASACIDIGSEALGDDPNVGFDALGLTAWSAQSTSAELVLDANGSSASDLDAGRHYGVGDVTIDSFDVDANAAQWTTRNAQRCWLFGGDDLEVLNGDSSTQSSGELSHDLASGSDVALLCGGASGPSLAFGRVP